MFLQTQGGPRPGALHRTKNNRIPGALEQGRPPEATADPREQAPGTDWGHCATGLVRIVFFLVHLPRLQGTSCPEHAEPNHIGKRVPNHAEILRVDIAATAVDTRHSHQGSACGESADSTGVVPAQNENWHQAFFCHR